MSTHNPPTPPLSTSRITTHLLAWIHRGRRDLPWRRSRAPYAVWISEMMLQQTQAATVVPYFERWIARFPDVNTLAAAPLDDVLKAWEGLGYYARARNLHRASQVIVAEHAGRVPDTLSALGALPGIGRYSAGAILSLAYGQPQPVLDGNVRRVLCRLYDIDADPRAPAVEAELWRLARDLVEAAPADQAGDLNEALMELGALVCIPRRPACPACPLCELCLAHRLGVAEERPARKRKPALPHYDVVAGVITDADGRVLLIRRPPSGLLGGLWGLPGGRLEAGEEIAAGVVRTVQQQVGISVTPGERIATIAHAYTHFRITLHAFRCAPGEGEARPLRCAAVAWVPPAELANYAFPVTDRKVLAAYVPGTWCDDRSCAAGARAPGT